MLVKLVFAQVHQLQPHNLTIIATIALSNSVLYVGLIIFVTIALLLLYQVKVDPFVIVPKVFQSILKAMVVFVILVQFNLVTLA